MAQEETASDGSGGVDYLGIRATGGPLLETAMTLSPGLTVLYGLNGAGKSRVLTALHAALVGQLVGLDGEALDDELEVVLFARDRELAGKIAFNPPLDDPAIWEFPGNPYRRQDRALIIEAFLEATESDLVALGPDSRPGSGWVAFRAVQPLPDSAVGQLRDRDNAYLELVRRELLGDVMGSAKLCAAWGFDSDSTIDWRVDGTSFLHLRSYHPAETTGVDPLANVPTDDLPLVLRVPFGPDWSGTGRFNDQVALPVQVITNVGVHTVKEASVEAAYRAMSGVFVTEHGGWGTFEDQRAGASVLQKELAAASIQSAGGDPNLVDELEFTAPKMSPYKQWLEFTAALADALLHSFLLDAPGIAVVVSDHPVDVLGGTTLNWVTTDGLPLDALSNAERRWAVLAIRIALVATARRGRVRDLFSNAVPTVDNLQLPEGTFLLLDEPETALHRTAEAHMALGLASLARMPGLHVVVATHSPHLMNLPSARVQRVYRAPYGVVTDSSGDGFEVRPISVTRVAALTDVARSDLAGLGLEPSDLLKRQKLILLVEGLHDEIVLRHFLAEELVDSRAQIIPLRGASQLPLAMDSRLLFDFTDATVIPIVDNVDPFRLTSIWEQATVLASIEGEQSAGAYLRQELDPKIAIENKFLRDFLSRAIESGLQSRVEPFSLPKKDILWYLPVEAFTSRASSWEEIYERHQQELSEGRTLTSDWKKWAAGVYGLVLGQSSIEAALSQVPGVPEDLQVLGALCRSLIESQR